MYEELLWERMEKMAGKLKRAGKKEAADVAGPGKSRWWQRSKEVQDYSRWKNGGTEIQEKFRTPMLQ